MPKKCNHNILIQDYTGRVFKQYCYHCGVIIEREDKNGKQGNSSIVKCLTCLSRKKQRRRII